MGIDRLDLVIRTLCDKGAIHRRKGTNMGTVKMTTICTHLLEEIAELQEEAFHGTYARQIEEAADVLGVFLHLVYAMGVPLNLVIERCESKMSEVFEIPEATTDAN